MWELVFFGLYFFHFLSSRKGKGSRTSCYWIQNMNVSFNLFKINISIGKNPIKMQFIFIKKAKEVHKLYLDTDYNGAC